jgi:hypothetical protein
MSKPRKRRGECAYCGKIGPVTDDHVPPKNMFGSPRPNNLVKVPSCKECNQGASKDDEYFRIWTTIREASKGNRDREAVLPATLRSLEREEAKGLQIDFDRSRFLAPQFTETGIYVGHQPAFVAEGRRLDRVTIRIVKGLFFDQRRKRLPSDYEVRAVHLSRVGEMPEYASVLMEFVQALLESPEHRIGSAFSYRTLQSPNGWARSVWLLEFYGSQDYFCTTQPLELPDVLVIAP